MFHACGKQGIRYGNPVLQIIYAAAWMIGEMEGS